MGKRSSIQIMAIAGARPNFMKIAPLVRELRRRDGFECFLVHSGQHYDSAMSESFFRDLGIPAPDVNLEVGSGTHAVQTGLVLMKMEELLVERRPDALVVVGDVNSTLAATIAAVKLGIPVAHVEAGLRSFDRDMPEELNRLMTDVVSSWLFTTEASGDENLMREGVPSERVHRVGNVMIDTLVANLDKARELPVLERLGVSAGEYAVLTLHRPSNVDDPALLSRLLDVLEEIHERVPIVFPVHPRTAAAIKALPGERSLSLKTLEPLGYHELLRLMADAKLVLTDSGGIQEETTALGVPCLTLRENTERPITVDEGTNTVVGVQPDAIRKEVDRILSGGGKAGRVPELWDGNAAIRIVDVLERDLRKGR